MQNTAVINNTTSSTTASNSDKRNACIKAPKFRLCTYTPVSNDEVKGKTKSVKDRRQEAVSKVIVEGEALCKKHEAYHNEYVVRGNKALYELLASIYDYALRIDGSEHKELILAGIKEKLQAMEVKVTAQTSWLTKIIKFIVRNADRQTASNYSRVLQVAYDEGLAAKDIADYIARRGGVTQIREVEALAEAKAKASELASKESVDRTQLMRDYLLATAYLAQTRINYNGEVLQYATKQGKDPSKESSDNAPTFRHFIAVDVDGRGEEFAIITSADFSKSFEDVVMRHMSVALGNDLKAAKEAITYHQAEKRKWQDECAAKKKAA